MQDLTLTVDSAAKTSLINSPFPLIIFETDGNVIWRSSRYISEFADIFTANSKQTCDYLAEKTGTNPVLIKNGVFTHSEASNIESLPAYQAIRKARARYRKVVGYAGKLGVRLDINLIKTITEKCKEILFVFVGSYLKDQKSSRLNQLMQNSENILLTGSVPSAYIHSVLDQFDLLMIPHSVGEAENGGDPEKLYHYLTRQRPIITTGILGVDEFEDEIMISNDADEWIKFINATDRMNKKSYNAEHITWETRFKPVLDVIENAGDM